MSGFVYYLAGVITLPSLLFLRWLLYLLRFACKDALWLIRNGELEEGRSKLWWLYLIPREFLMSMYQTATSIGRRV